MYGNRIIARICKKYDPSVIGYEWDEENPKIQLEPIGERGYIELHPIKISDKFIDKEKKIL